METDILLCVHIEADDEGEIQWWAESSDVPGFSALADSLVELEAQAKIALYDIAEQEGWTVGQVRSCLVPNEPLTGNPARGRVTPGDEVPAARAKAASSQYALAS